MKTIRHTLHKVIHKAILIFLFLCILISGYYIDLEHQWTRFLRARNHTHQLETDLKQTHQKILQTDQYKNLLSKTQAEFDRIKIILPQTSNLQSFIDAVIQSGKVQGLTFLAVHQQASTTNTKDFYHIMPVELTILGTYQQFLNFLTLLNAEHYFINIDNFAMTRQQPAETTVLKNNHTPDILMMNATAEFYYY